MLEKINRAIANYNYHMTKLVIKLSVLTVIMAGGLSMCHHIKGTPESKLALAIADRLDKDGYSNLADQIILKPTDAGKMANSICQVLNEGVALSIFVDKLEEKWIEEDPEKLPWVEPVVIEGIKSQCPQHINQVKEIFPDA